MAHDDTNSNEAFEQLAAMYLTDFQPPAVDPVPKSKHGDANAPSGSNPNAPAHLRLAGGDDVDGDSDAAATTGADDHGTPTVSTSAPLTIEGVLIGHLPGFANLWLGQYAQRLARSRGPVAVMIADETSIELELYGDLPADAWPAALNDAPSRSLEEVLAALAEASAVWLVRLPGETVGASARVAEAVDAWTLLTGANDAAVVQAYRMIKQATDACEQRVPQGQVQLMLCGCDAEDGEQAADRLTRTTAQYLRLMPKLIGVQRRMEPIRKKRLGAFDVDEPWALLADLLRASPTNPIELRPDPDGDAPLLDPVDGIEAFEDDDTDAAADERDLIDLSDLDIAEGDLLDDESFAALDDDDDADEQSDIELELEPETASDTVTHDTAPSADDDNVNNESLVQYVHGVEAIEARCPSHGAIELGVDGNGALQLLAQTAGDPQAALRDAYDTRAWAVEHAQLLRLTCPTLDLDTDREPTVHLFTDRPQRLGELAYRGKRGQRPIRLHLLLPVTVGDATTWTHVELN